MRFFARRAGIILSLCFVFALLHVWTRVLVVQNGYQIRQMMDEQEKLKGEAHTLRLELATLRSPFRLEKMAQQMGLKKPPEKTVTMISARDS